MLENCSRKNYPNCHKQNLNWERATEEVQWLVARGT